MVVSRYPRKHGRPSSGWWHPAFHVPGLCSSFLPVKGLSASGAGSVPLAQFPFHVSLLEVCLLSHSFTAAQFIRLPLHYRTSIRFSQTGPCGFSFLNTPAGSQTSGTTLDKACHVTKLCVVSCFPPSERSASGAERGGCQHSASTVCTVTAACRWWL